MPHRPNQANNSSGSTATMNSSRKHVVNGVTCETAAPIMRPLATMPPSMVYEYGDYSNYRYHHQQQHHQQHQNRHPAASWSPSLERRGTDSSKDEDCTVATLTTEGSEDKREATASALLGLQASSPTTVPLKKRKRQLAMQQADADANNTPPDATSTTSSPAEPCHVSPVSHASSSQGRTLSQEEVTPDRTRVQPSTSYEYGSKSPQQLLESCKIRSSADIPQVVIPHFPSVLHQVLSDSEYAGTVLAWLPDGEAWKVLRWDALRRQVLPRYFLTLRDEHGGACGTIDAFLYHLTLWGFQEQTDGTEVGAYKHELFIRGAHKLCSKMRSTTTTDSVSVGVSTPPKQVTPARPPREDRSMLQVPTLSAMKRPRYEDASPTGMHGVRRSSPLGWMGYREDPYDNKAWGNYYDPSRNLYAMQDPRYMMPATTTSEPLASPAPYAPLRSGRGASRMVSRSPSTTTTVSSTSGASPLTTPAAPVKTATSSFPVSNRGKGRSRKVTSPSTSTVTSTPASNEVVSAPSPVSVDDAHRIGAGVAMAISRKRKLPIQRPTEEV
eukprot:Nitzschia sp. Nitz4//scaffold17_size182527//32594//34350//NITZ4_001834-RA/size182527-snap-gene-0.288-mRNA-1//-1//CDS//3329539280//4248//frame0